MNFDIEFSCFVDGRAGRIEVRLRPGMWTKIGPAFVSENGATVHGAAQKSGTER